MKRFELQFGKVASGFVIESFDRMVESGEILNSEIKTMLANHYSDNDIPHSARPSQHKISDAIKEYSEHRGYDVLTNVSMRVDAFSTGKGRKFVAKDPPF